MRAETNKASEKLKTTKGLKQLEELTILTGMRQETSKNRYDDAPGTSTARYDYTLWWNWTKMLNNNIYDINTRYIFRKMWSCFIYFLTIVFYLISCQQLYTIDVIVYILNVSTSRHILFIKTMWQTAKIKLQSITICSAIINFCSVRM